jgi:hypothetical protein
MEGKTMKQRITIEQLQELTEKQKKRLSEMWKPQEGDCIYIHSGVEYGDGYGGIKTKSVFDCKREACVSYIGNVEIGEGKTYKKCILEPEFGSDNYFEISFENCLPLLSVGQLIELLSPVNGDRLGKIYEQVDTEKLCDALWEAVIQEVLTGN